MKVEGITKETIEFFKKHKRKIECTALLVGTIMIPIDEAIMEEHDQKEFTRQMNMPKVEQSVDYEVSKLTEPVTLQTDDGREVRFIENNELEENVAASANNKENIIDIHDDEEIIKSITDVANLGRVVVSAKNGTVNHEFYLSELDSESKVKEIVESLSDVIRNNDEENVAFHITTSWMKTNNYSAPTAVPNSPKKLATAPENREYQRTTYTIRPNETINWEYFKDENGKIQYSKLVKYFLDGDKEDILDISGSVETIIVNEQDEKQLNTTIYSMEIDGMDLEIKVRPRNLGEQLEGIGSTALLVTGVAGSVFLVGLYFYTAYQNYKRTGLFVVK